MQQQCPAAAGAPAVPRTRPNKAQALSAFRSMVEGAAFVRQPLPGPTTDPSKHQPPAPDSSTPGTAQQQECVLPAKCPQATTRDEDLTRTYLRAAATTEQAAPVHQAPPLFPGTTAASAAPAGTPPSQLIPAALKALQKLQSQLSSRTLTYIYQLDGLLSTASRCLGAVAAHFTTTHTVAAGALPLQQLLQEQQGEAVDGSAALDLLLQLCSLSWVRVSPVFGLMCWAVLVLQCKRGDMQSKAEQGNLQCCLRPECICWVRIPNNCPYTGNGRHPARVQACAVVALGQLRMEV